MLIVSYISCAEYIPPIWVRPINSYWMVLLKMLPLWVRKVKFWNIPNNYPNISKIYKDVPRYTKYQAAAGPARPSPVPRGSGPARARSRSGLYSVKKRCLRQALQTRDQRLRPIYSVMTKYVLPPYKVKQTIKHNCINSSIAITV